MATARFEIEGMSCNHCVQSVDRALRAMNGVSVKRVAVGSAEVEFDPAANPETSIVTAIEKAGYEARPAAKSCGGSAGGSCGCG